MEISTRVSNRFWAKVTKGDGCWNWTGCNRGTTGYGYFWFEGRGWAAHRFSYLLAHGESPAEMFVDHVCHNTSCVNPDHLRLVSNKQNQENQLGAAASSQSGIRGVHWHSKNNRWQASLRHHGKKIHVGYFLTAEEAEAAVREKRVELFTHNDLDRVAA